MKCPNCRVGEMKIYASLVASLTAMASELKHTMGGEPSGVPLLGNLVQYARDVSGKGPQSVRSQYKCGTCGKFAVECPKCSGVSRVAGPLGHIEKFNCSECQQSLIFRLD